MKILSKLSCFFRPFSPVQTPIPLSPRLFAAGWIGWLMLLGVFFTLPFKAWSQMTFNDDGEGILRGSTTKIERFENPENPNKFLFPNPKPYVPIRPSLVEGKKLVNSYKLQAAETQFRKILEQSPNNAQAHLGLGTVYFEKTTSSNQEIRDKATELYQEAIQEYLSALRYQPNFPEARLALAKVYLELGRTRDASEEIDRAYQSPSLQNGPQRNSKLLSQAQGLQGAIQLRQGQINEAFRLLEAAVANNPFNASAYFYLGVVRTERGEYTQALDALTSSLTIFPNSAPVHYQMGVIYERQGNGGAAVNEFKKAIAIKPENVPANLKLADHYKRRGDLGGCLEVLKNLLESYPASEPLKIQVASLSVDNKQPEVARKFYQEILQENPQNSEALKGLSLANLQIGQRLKNEETLQAKENAKGFLTEALQANPDNLTATLRQQRLEPKTPPFSPQKPAPLLPLGNQPSDSLKRGQVYWENNQFQRANQAFEIALLGYPRPEDTLLLGEIFKEQGHLSMAEKAFRLVFDQSDPNTTFHQAALKGIQDAQKNKRTAQGLVTEAQQHLKERLPQRAIQLIQESLEIHRLNPEAHRLLGEAYEKNQQPSMAIAAYQHYLDLEPSLEARKQIQRHLEQLEKR